MRTIAKSGGWTVELDANSIVVLRGPDRFSSDFRSSYEAIKIGVTDEADRKVMLQQWAAAQ